MEQTKEIFKRLTAPFTIVGSDGKIYHDHKWKMQSKNGLCVPYITSAQVSQRLNDVLGFDGWNNMLIETTGKFIICELTIIIDGKNITRSDVGTPSDYNGEKGQASDALKRAASRFGIGAYLRDIGNIKLNTVNKSGKTYPATQNGEALLDGEMLSSYINQTHPLRAKLTEIYNYLSKEDQKKLSKNFTEIWEALTK